MLCLFRFGDASIQQRTVVIFGCVRVRSDFHRGLRPKVAMHHIYCIHLSIPISVVPLTMRMVTIAQKFNLLIIRCSFVPNQGHGVLRAMVKSGIPMRESTKREVPSLLPLPTADGFVWHQRKRKRRPPPAALRASSPAFMMRRREAAIRLLLDPSTDEPIARAYRRGVNSHKKSREEEANGGEGKGVAVGRFEGVERLSLGLGWLLVSDWRFRKSEMAQNVELFGVRALERKRRRMHEFSLRRKMEENQRGDDVTMLGSTAPPCPSNGESRGTKLADERLYGVVAPRPGLDLKPGGRRGRNEAVSLWMRYQRTPGVLGRGTSRLQSRRPEAAEPYARSLGSDSSKVPARGASRREEGRTSQS